MTAPVRLTRRGQRFVRSLEVLLCCSAFYVGVFAPWYWVRVR